MTGAPTQAELDAARLVLDRMGVTAEDLLNAVKPPAPTFGEYIPVVAAAVSDGTRRAYTPYWNRVLDQWADISLSDRTPTDIQRLVQHIKANLTVRRNTRNGNSAAEHLIAALRCLYRHAVNDDLIDERANPAAKVPKPRRQPSNRRALSGKQMDQLNDIVATTRNDPRLDSLIVRFHTAHSQSHAVPPPRTQRRTRRHTAARVSATSNHLADTRAPADDSRHVRGGVEGVGVVRSRLLHDARGLRGS
ncbi:hypothetical protein C8D87_10132 [Lentzea atacamensis]|uniref:Core-binding (CB) domain-containing protein n=1 Tax=Lentzea atacamensis TaxID=531938 RepID=A0ABX9EFR8_9PSEU|nr:hypothetical protein C8D87_10132 [Lentzea atacamensis]